MARTAFSINVDISAVEGLAEQLGELTTNSFGELARTAVNRTAVDVYNLTMPRMVETLNISETYVRQRVDIKLATSQNNPTAALVARGDRSSTTQLRNYDARQLIVAAKRPARAKGDTRHGIPAGKKSGGVSVQVLRGSTKTMPGAFLVELKNGNGWGIATRTGPGKKDYKVRYGPSVYQMFKYAAQNVLEEASDMLKERLTIEAERMLENNLKSRK